MAAGAQPSLEDLKDGRFNKEPKKWTLNSRFLMVHMFFNVIGEKAPRTQKGKLPSIDADALEKMGSPLAQALVAYRSDAKTLGSLQSATAFIRPQSDFNGGLVSPTGEKAIIRYSPLGYDNIERVFSVKDVSIPLNVDKRGRNAFITPPATKPTAEVLQADPRNQDYLVALLQPAH